MNDKFKNKQKETADTSQLENIVAVNLRRLYGKEVYFYHNGVEVDFYVPEEKLAIQASFSLDDAETIDREVAALDKLSQRLPCEKRMIITRHDETELTTKQGIIFVVPLWKWLLNHKA